MTKIISPPFATKKSLWERVYVLEILRGLFITIGHLLSNMGGLGKGRVGMTWQYPETPKPIDNMWKGEHRLMLREDGRPRCVACQCCATACPAVCIEIVGADYGVAGVEKYPAVFNIDILQCVFCGMCVEACPCDAIRMDSQKFVGAVYEGPSRILDIDYLLNNHPEHKSKVSERIY
ncbi:MAG: 4Fe-4S dicluster domain-containing protein [Chitinivibrionia bacterium]|nr:4Fe-4S dicluster domain-containing protein [Chitinivibrionia bacterium]